MPSSDRPCARCQLPWGRHRLGLQRVEVRDQWQVSVTHPGEDGSLNSRRNHHELYDRRSEAYDRLCALSREFGVEPHIPDRAEREMYTRNRPPAYEFRQYIRHPDGTVVPLSVEALKRLAAVQDPNWDPSLRDDQTLEGGTRPWHYRARDAGIRPGELYTAPFPSTRPGATQQPAPESEMGPSSVREALTELERNDFLRDLQYRVHESYGIDPVNLRAVPPTSNTDPPFSPVTGMTFEQMAAAQRRMIDGIQARADREAFDALTGQPRDVPAAPTPEPARQGGVDLGLPGADRAVASLYGIRIVVDPALPTGDAYLVDTAGSRITFRDPPAAGQAFTLETFRQAIQSLANQGNPHPSEMVVSPAMVPVIERLAQEQDRPRRGAPDASNRGPSDDPLENL